ncbi:MAG: aldehyde ferredoxin oxidoreductase [Promethearchaeota archaeon]|nr:MAG: aldehyde ferredoxin oxidoreductase [Candidatus Lokiarchaeota archaeon]
MKIVRINLNSKNIQSEPITTDSKFYLLGARGLTSQIVHDEVPPQCNPFGPKNKLIIANGLLAGSPFPNSARTSIGSKSPLTNGIKEANVGGRPAMMLARYAIRAIILEDQSSSLHLILVNDEGIHLVPCDEYKGLGNYELHKRLQKRYREKIGIYSIGPAGEYMMRSSTVAANDLEGYPSRHAARGGLGAVMGSKKIKAVVITPTKTSKVRIHDLNRFRKVSKPFAQSLAASKQKFSIFGTAMMMKGMSGYGGLPTKNFRKGSYSDIDKISGEMLHEIVTSRGGRKKLACSPTCVIRCSNLVLNEEGNHVTSSFEYETMALNGSNLLINDIDKLTQIDHLCDDVGIDTIEFGGTCGVAMDCGKIQWGEADKIIEILDKDIRINNEIGKTYGNGVKNIGELLHAQRVPHVKGQGMSAYDPRIFKAMSVTFATSPMGADHTSGAAIAGREASQHKDYGELTNNKGKLDLSFELQVYTAVLDSLGCCYFIGPSFENMEIISNALNAMYDLDLARDDVIKIGENILRTELDFNKKAAIGSETNDVPEFFKKEQSKPRDLIFTFREEDLKNFWKRLNNYTY